MNIQTRASLRTLLYKLCPDWAPYILHLRPRSMGIVFAQASVGFFLANGLDLTAKTIQLWLFSAFIWTVLLNGGTLALNSAFDNDEGDIGYLQNPPPPPRYLVHFGLGLMLLGVGLAYTLGWRFFIAVLVCFIMSIVYSVPPLRFKARPGLDLLINMVGYGGLTTYAGWAATGRPFESPMVNVFWANVFFMAGFYPLTQIYQMGQDARRGDHTLALALGKTRAILVGFLGVALGFGFLLLETAQIQTGLRALVLGVGAAAWILVLVPWYRLRDKVDEGYEQRGFYNALKATAVTDLAILAAFMPLIWM
jgi:lycopene elongase/hydratase (dihydrobisanhydrobacterioruberin-forming)